MPDLSRAFGLPAVNPNSTTSVGFSFGSSADFALGTSPPPSPPLSPPPPGNSRTSAQTSSPVTQNLQAGAFLGVYANNTARPFASSALMLPPGAPGTSTFVSSSSGPLSNVPQFGSNSSQKLQSGAVRFQFNRPVSNTGGALPLGPPPGLRNLASNSTDAFATRAALGVGPIVGGGAFGTPSSASNQAIVASTPTNTTSPPKFNPFKNHNSTPTGPPPAPSPSYNFVWGFAPGATPTFAARNMFNTGSNTNIPANTMQWSFPQTPVMNNTGFGQTPTATPEHVPSTTPAGPPPSKSYGMTTTPSGPPPTQGNLFSTTPAGPPPTQNNLFTSAPGGSAPAFGLMGPPATPVNKAPSHFAPVTSTPPPLSFFAPMAAAPTTNSNWGFTAPAAAPAIPTSVPIPAVMGSVPATPVSAAPAFFNFAPATQKTTSAPAMSATTSNVQTATQSEFFRQTITPPYDINSRPQYSRLQNQTMEETIIQWTSDIEKYKADFQEKGTKVEEWDSVLVESHGKIVTLSSEVKDLERTQSIIDNAFEQLESDQINMSHLLDYYEAAFDAIEKSSSPAQPIDEEREGFLESIQNLSATLVHMDGQANDMISALNNANGKIQGISADINLSNIVNILNQHLHILKWVNSQTAALSVKILAADAKINAPLYIDSEGDETMRKFSNRF